MADTKRQKDRSDGLFASTLPTSRETMSSSRMAYMADLLLELKDMATAEGHATLAGLLALAHMEALQKTR
jgi:hypothetical protein